MRYSVYDQRNSKWISVQPTDTKAFLQKYKHVLTDNLLQSTIKRLKSYKATKSKQPATLTLGGCRIVVSNTNEAIELLACVETTLESNIKNN